MTSAPAPPRSHEEQIADLRAARLTALGTALASSADTAVDFEVLLAGGWRPDTYAWLASLGAHAVRERTGAALSQTAGDMQHVAEPRIATFRLARVAESAATMQVALPQLAGWLSVLASEPDRALYRRLATAVRFWGSAPGPGRIGRDLLTAVRHWTAQVGPAAAWAWAAGLTGEEMRARHDAGGLNTAALRTLAGLRGYRIPQDSQ